MARLDPKVLEEELRLWVGEQADQHDAEASALAIDGKTLCSTMAAHGRSVQLLSLLDQHTSCVLRQMPVPSEIKEAKAALSILNTIALRARVVMGDAVFAHPAVCRAIVGSGGDYPLVTNDNQREFIDAIDGDLIHLSFPLLSVRASGVKTPRRRTASSTAASSPVLSQPARGSFRFSPAGPAWSRWFASNGAVPTDSGEEARKLG